MTVLTKLINESTKVLNALQLGVKRGPLSSNTERQANLSLLNQAVDEADNDGMLLYLPPGDYEIWGSTGFLLPHSYLTCFGAGGARVVQHKLDAPCSHVGPPVGTAGGATIEGFSLDGVQLRFAGNATASLALDGESWVGGHGLEITGAFRCRFGNLEIGDPNQGASSATSVPFAGVYCDPRAGTVPCFSNSFYDIRCKNFSRYGWHQYRNAFDSATGNHYSNIYLSAGGGGDVRDISADDGVPLLLGSLSQFVWNQCNIEWVTCRRAAFLGSVNGALFNGLNLEGVTLKSPSAETHGLVEHWGGYAKYRGTMIQNCTFDAANNVTNPSFFRVHGGTHADIEVYPIANNKNGISNLAVLRNWDFPSGNTGMSGKLPLLQLGDGDQLDMVSDIVFSGGPSAFWTQLADFNNCMVADIADGNATIYAYRTPGVYRMATSATTRNITLHRNAGATLSTRIPAGTRRRLANTGTGSIQAKDYDGTTNVGSTIGAGGFRDYSFDGANWKAA